MGTWLYIDRISWENGHVRLKYENMTNLFESLESSCLDSLIRFLLFCCRNLSPFFFCCLGMIDSTQMYLKKKKKTLLIITFYNQTTVFHFKNNKIACMLTVMTLKFWTGRFGPTVQSQIRLFLEEQSDQGLHCLLFQCHVLD